jgi:hypothetical protein
MGMIVTCFIILLICMLASSGYVCVLFKTPYDPSLNPTMRNHFLDLNALFSVVAAAATSASFSFFFAAAAFLPAELAILVTFATIPFFVVVVVVFLLTTVVMLVADEALLLLTVLTLASAAAVAAGTFRVRTLPTVDVVELLVATRALRVGLGFSGGGIAFDGEIGTR